MFRLLAIFKKSQREIVHFALKKKKFRAHPPKKEFHFFFLILIKPSIKLQSGNVCSQMNEVHIYFNERFSFSLYFCILFLIPRIHSFRREPCIKLTPTKKKSFSQLKRYTCIFIPTKIYYKCFAVCYIILFIPRD